MITAGRMQEVVLHVDDDESREFRRHGDRYVGRALGGSEDEGGMLG